MVKASDGMTAGTGADNRQLGADEPDAHRVPVLPPLAALVELAVLSGAIMLVDWLFTSVDLAELHPSPYWVPVLLLSLQYGAVSGMLAAIIASIATIYAGFPEQGIGENYFVYFMRVWALPIVWLGVAIVVGQFRTRQIALKQGLRRRVTELSAERAALADHVGNLRQRCDALEREIAGREDRASAPVFLDRLAALEDRARPFRDGFRDLLEAALPGAHVVLYEASAEGFVAVADTAPHAGVSAPDRLASADSLVNGIATSRVLSVLDADGEAMLGGRGIIAAAVDEGGAPGAAGEAAARRAGMAGLLLVTEAPGQLVRAELVDRLGVLAALVGQARRNRSAAAGGVVTREPVRPWRQRRWLRVRSKGAGGSSAPTGLTAGEARDGAADAAKSQGIGAVRRAAGAGPRP
jgi:hypothetical protein